MSLSQELPCCGLLPSSNEAAAMPLYLWSSLHNAYLLMKGQKQPTTTWNQHCRACTPFIFIKANLPAAFVRKENKHHCNSSHHNSLQKDTARGRAQGMLDIFLCKQQLQKQEYATGPCVFLCSANRKAYGTWFRMINNRLTVCIEFIATHFYSIKSNY